MTNLDRAPHELAALQLNHSADALVILDQTLLPNEERYLCLGDLPSIHEAIVSLRVRGAPAIGITAAYGVYLAVKACQAADFSELERCFKSAKLYLETSRPTAVNLFWALNRMETCLYHKQDLPAAAIIESLRREADQIFREDAEINLSMGRHGLTLLSPGDGLLTHCNAGTLATARWGTALAPIYLGQTQGYAFKVFADETRPLLQGARLTTYELMRAGVDVTLICDNMAASVMKKGLVQAVLVGCDRLAANGDAANKIGTLGLAILARHFKIPFYVFAPLSTIDPECFSGQMITIEQRPPEEVTEKWYQRPMAPPEVKVCNPAFDVTDHGLISAIITEQGILRPPFATSLAGLFVKNI